MQTAKTLSKGEVEIGGAGQLGGYNTPVHKSIKPFFNGEAWVRGGVGSSLDVGLKMSVNGGLLADIKWQFVGDKESLFAVGTGLGVGLGADLGGFNYNLNFPLFFSVHPNEKLDLFLNPKFLVRATPNSEADVPTFYEKYLGGSAGFFYGDKVKVGAEISVSHKLTDDEFFKTTTLQLGVGIKYRF